MADNYVLVAPQSHTDWTAEIILERDEDGNVTKSVNTTVPVELNEKDRKVVEELGYKVERVNKSEAEELREQAAQSGGDVTGAAPVFGSQGDKPDQKRETQGNK